MIQRRLEYIFLVFQLVLLFFELVLLKMLQVGLRHVTPLVIPREVFITQAPLACTRAESRHKNTARNVASGVHVNRTPLYTTRAVFGEENAACRATSGVLVT